MRNNLVKVSVTFGAVGALVILGFCFLKDSVTEAVGANSDMPFFLA